MKFIEVSDGVSINIDDIVVVSKKGEFTSEIQTQNNIYTANFPYRILLDILERERETEKEPVKRIEKTLGELGTFAG